MLLCILRGACDSQIRTTAVLLYPFTPGLSHSSSVCWSMHSPQWSFYFSQQSHRAAVAATRWPTPSDCLTSGLSCSFRVCWSTYLLRSGRTTQGSTPHGSSPGWQGAGHARARKQNVRKRRDAHHVFARLGTKGSRKHSKSTYREQQAKHGGRRENVTMLKGPSCLKMQVHPHLLLVAEKRHQAVNIDLCHTMGKD